MIQTQAHQNQHEHSNYCVYSIAEQLHEYNKLPIVNGVQRIRHDWSQRAVVFRATNNVASLLVLIVFHTRLVFLVGLVLLATHSLIAQGFRVIGSDAHPLAIRTTGYYSTDCCPMHISSQRAIIRAADHIRLQKLVKTYTWESKFKSVGDEALTDEYVDQSPRVGYKVFL
jgi:hypothetical protein